MRSEYLHLNDTAGKTKSFLHGGQDVEGTGGRRRYFGMVLPHFGACKGKDLICIVTGVGGYFPSLFRHIY